MLHTLAELHQALAVTDASGGAVEHGGVELLGDLAGQADKVLALLGVAGLHHGDLGGAGVVTVVLLVLGGVAGGIVGGDDHVGAVDAHVAGGEQGVGGHVQPHHLHGAEGTGAGHGRAVGHLGGDLLVGGPLTVHVLTVLGQVLQDLGAGGSGIRGTDLDTGFVDAAGGGLVTGHQMFHSSFHLSCLFSSYFHLQIKNGLSIFLPEYQINTGRPPAGRGGPGGHPPPGSASPPRRAGG